MERAKDARATAMERVRFRFSWDSSDSLVGESGIVADWRVRWVNGT